jgi:hypothetical protein
MAFAGNVSLSLNTQRGALAAPTPDEGRVGLPVSVDFSLAQDVTYDFTLLTNGKQFSVVRTLMLDNSANPNAVVITVSNTGQRLNFPPYSFGAVPISALGNSSIRLQTNGGGSANTYVEFFNYDISPFITSGFGPITPGQISGVYGIDGATRMALANPFAVTQAAGTVITNRNAALGVGVASDVFPGGASAVGVRFRNIGAGDATYRIGGTANGSFAAGDKQCNAGDPWLILPYRYSGRISFLSAAGTNIEAEEFS